jgi:H+/Na+-translocating ferredoxin:NAD+ oxidoreductase subunit G
MAQEPEKFPKVSKLAIALLLVCLSAALAVGGIFDMTKETIAEQIRLKKLRLLHAVLPATDNDVDKDFKEIVVGKDKRGNDVTVRYYFGRKEGQLVGTAFSLVTPEGFSGDIEIMMGVDPGGAVTGVEIVQATETPGLGDKIQKDQKWRESFQGKSLTNAKWAVKKDGGDFDQFTGATITPRAVVKVVKKGLDLYQEEFGNGKS